MIIHRGFDGLSPDNFRNPAVTIGVFDGIHLGHRAVIDATRDLAREYDGESVAVTFEIHPRQVLAGKAPAQIASVPHRLVLLERSGIDHAVILPFDDTVRNISATDFADRVFLHGIGARGIVLGFDSRFGKDRQGDLGFLLAWARSLREEGVEIDVRAAPPVLKDGRPISSSAIRAAISRGEHDVAQSMLGRPVAVYGRVVKGSGRGRTIGFPTANLDLMGELAPPNGVYAAFSRIAGTWRPSLVNIGTRPTFDGIGDIFVEVFVPGLAADLYGAEIEVQFVRRIREERKFPDAEALIEQIHLDREELDRIVAEARA